MNLKPNILVLMAAMALMLTPKIQGQTTSPPYLSQFPSVERVKGEIKGSDATDTAARQSAAFWWLNQIAMAVGGSGKLVSGSDSGLLYSRYIDAFRSYAQIHASGRNPRWEQLLETYKYDPVFGDELIKRFFTADFRAGYYKFSGKQPPQVTTSQPKTPPTAQPSEAAGGRLYYDAAGNWKYQDQLGGVYDKNGYTWADGSLTTNSGIQVKAGQPNIVDNGDGTKTDLKQELGRPVTLQEARQFATNLEEDLQSMGYSQPNTAEAVMAKEKRSSSSGPAVESDRIASHSAPGAGPKTTSKPSQPGPTASLSAEAYLAEGIRHNDGKDYAGAIEAYKKAISLNPKMSEAYHRMAGAYFLLNRNQEALLAIKEAIRLKPNAASYFLLGSIHFDLNQGEQALPALQQAVRLKPDYVLAQYYLGRTYVRTGRKQEALEVYQALKSHDATKAQQLYVEINKGSSLPPKGGKSANTLSRATESGSADAYFAQGNKYREAKDYAKAVDEYKKAIALKPSMSQAYDGLGLAYYELNQYENAIAALREAIRLKPNDPDYYDHLGQSYYVLDDRLPEAIAAYKEVIRLRPGDDLNKYVFQFTFSGNSYYNKNLPQKALEYYRGAISLDPEYEQGHFLTGVVYNDINQYDKAVPALREALRLQPNDQEASYQLGKAYLKLGQYPNAVTAFQQCVRLKPNVVLAHYGLGIAYLSMGQKNQAIQVYRRLQTMDKEAAQALFAEISKAK